jgi:tetratricopeptide (TPR) repeat protein
MQGLVHSYLRHDFDSAARSYADALSINPNESMATLLLGTMHAFLGEGDAAWTLTQASLRLSPLDPLRYFYLSLSASAAIAAGRYDDAIDMARRSLKCNRMHLSTYRALAIAQALAGRLDDARQTVREMLVLEPAFTLERFRERFPGRERAPEYTAFLVDALERAGLPR